MVYYFSGQGNSRLVAEAIAGKLRQETCRITRRTLDAASSAQAPDTDRPNVWVFPVHAWGVPRVVGKFIRTLASAVPGAASGSVHHMVATCGDDIGRTDRQWARMIRSRGWRVGGVFSVTMPNTYVCLPGFDVDSPDLARDKMRRASEDVDSIASRIADNRADGLRMVVAGSMPRIKSHILRPLFNAFLMSPRGFRVDRDKCDGCGTCAAVCPMGNITIDGGAPRWDHDCTMCLACYHRCPRGAVAYHFTAGKGRVGHLKNSDSQTRQTCQTGLTCPTNPTAFILHTKKAMCFSTSPFCVCFAEPAYFLK
ncbi:EFR1 family ferrodoxin [uncultured Muribaculum sp.]|uniref:EFR1 family ferrodoxin n=1 Tax=uncultured Muribaculum sp. TaxID=1918613 RepID=UPI0025F56CEA|nr:EFR1 family ferrodoxin [uncultured Muribaculum sp.]